MEAATNIGAASVSPEPGDITICLYCGAKLKFDTQLKQVPLSVDEFEKLDPETREQFRKISRLIRTPVFRDRLKLPPLTV
ncbi:hypothetical protein [Prosthecobacter sp.]|uniref:hypothetical protein n=1 Tax=Prosthecobacter sp. TaxID=1965333 RepID=UPI0037852D3C